MEETKRKLPEGLYEATVPLRGNPAELREKMRHYVAPSTLGKAEDEEAAMRIIWPSIEQGQWLGVTWQYMVEQMRRERHDSEVIETDRMIKSKKQWFVVKAERQRYLLLCLLTLGLYCLFSQWPQVVRLEAPDTDDVPISVVTLYGGPQPIVDGVYRLLERKLVTTTIENNVEIIFPTQELINAVTKTA